MAAVGLIAAFVFTVWYCFWVAQQYCLRKEGPRRPLTPEEKERLMESNRRRREALHKIVKEIDRDEKEWERWEEENDNQTSFLNDRFYFTFDWTEAWTGPQDED